MISFPYRSLASALRRETVGGALLVGAAALGLLSANAPWAGAYATLSTARFGPASWQLDLTPAAWCADGLLAVFFFVAGLELKRELVVGDLAEPARAVVPVVAAAAGMVVPALVFLATAAGSGGARGWAVPTATDIAFALAVLAVASPRGSGSRRTFLLTLAVVDDLLAITIIAIAYTDRLALTPLLLAALPLGGFALVTRWRPHWWWLLLPLALLTWGLVHASGVHATVAGVLLGVVVPVTGRDGGRDIAAHYERRWRPVTAGVVLPLFAFVAAGVPVAAESLRAALADGVTWGVVLGLLVGKTVGVAGAAWLLPRISRARLAADLGGADLLALGLLAGVGFTVSLLIGELAFGSGSPADDHARLGVLIGSVLSAVLAALVLGVRDRARRG